MKTLKTLKHIALLVGILLTSFVSVGQSTIEIGGGGTGNKYYVPIGTLYNYSITEQLYTADEISVSGIIESISFHYLGTDSKDFPISVYMKQVSNTDLSTGISLADAELVFSGTYSVNGSDWFTINLDNPFTYNGTSNLLIGINKGYVQWYSGGNWQTSSISNMAKYSWNDNNGYDLTTIPSISTNRPDIRIEITTDECLLNVPYYQDFDGDELPCWGVRDFDNDGETWYWVNAGTFSHSGESIMVSYSYDFDNNIFLSPDNLLYTPKFYIPNDGNEYFLKWWSRQLHSNYNDFYRLYVYDSDIDDLIDLTGQISSTTSWEEHTLSLLNYAGKIVYFMFDHFETTNGIALLIDDFSIDYCHQPSNIITDGSLTTADVSWDANGDNYTIYVYAENTELIDFENNELPDDFINDASYPWEIVNESYESGHNGTYCIKSGNSGVASSTSEISITKTFIQNGNIRFLGGIWGEGMSTIWDKCIFEIDGIQQFSYGARDTWETYTFNVTAGEHTFTWKYNKDSSVDPTGDAFYIDDISFVSNTLVQGPLYSSTNSYTIENLNPASEYMVQIESDCGNSSALSLLSTSFTVPITLLEFSAEPRYDQQTGVHVLNLLTIRTGYEYNNCEFIVYRSEDAINWDYDNPVCDWDFGQDSAIYNEALDTVLNYFTIEHPNGQTYYPVDYEPYEVTYYKLIQRDCDNTSTEYTSEIIVCIANQQKHLIEPYVLCNNGPQVVGGSEVCEVFVQNVLGQVVEEFQLQPYQQREVLAKIQGMYLITFVYKYNGEARKKTEKIICM